PDERDRVDARREHETIGGETRIGTAGRRERAHDDAIDAHLEGLPATLVGGTLSGAETHVVVSCRERHLLTEAAGVLREGARAARRGGGVARGEASAVAGDARLPHESPR